MTEVKESDRIGDDSPQMDAVRVKVEFLNTGRSEVLADLPIQGPSLRPRLKTHLTVLRDALARAGEAGFAFSKSGEAASIYALDARALNWREPEVEMRRFRQRERSFGQRLGLAWAISPTLYGFDSMSRIRRDERHAVGVIAPYSIFPFDAEVCAALLLGIVNYRTVINIDVIESYLRMKGWTILRPKGPDRFAQGFLWLARNGAMVRVPLPLAEQLLVELLSLSAFEKSIAAGWEAVRNAPDEQLHVGWAYEEDAVWF